MEVKAGTAPIGVFDSGLGGLTVLKALSRRLPGEDFLYYGDTAHIPYGNKSADAVTRYSLSITRFLQDKGVKLIVTACNTASVYALETLKRELDIPVVGVAASGAAAAVQGGDRRVGVIGTYGTVKSGAYERLIKEISPRTEVISRACPLFVPLVEEGWVEHPVTAEVAGIYLEPLIGRVTSVILACTHYPVIKKTIEEVLGPEIRVIDSALEVAKTVEKMIENNGAGGKDAGKCRFYVSDAPELFALRSPLFMGGLNQTAELAAPEDLK